MKLIKSIFACLLCIQAIDTSAQNEIIFRSLDEAYSFAETNSSVFRNLARQTSLAKSRTWASKLGIINLRGPSGITLTDNTKLGTSFIPAEIFGGQPGDFRPVTFGQKYVSDINFQIQFDLINPHAMAQVRGAEINEKLTELSGILTKKTVYESICATYHNILSCQWQMELLEKALANAQMLVNISVNKQIEGLIRPQDVNTTKAGRLAISDKVQQMKIQLEQQYNYLKLLCEIDPLTHLRVVADLQADADFRFRGKQEQGLLRRQAEWQLKYHQAVLRADKRWTFPSLSFFGSSSWQENNNARFFGSGDWFPNRYIGFRLSVPLLPEISKIAAVRADKLNLEIARNNLSRAEQQDRINEEQLRLGFQKALDSYEIAVQIELLHRESYQKNLDLYNEGVQSTTDTMHSFENWLNSNINVASALGAVEYAKSMVLINEAIK